MATVSTIDGIKYGFRLLGYGLAVFLIAGLVMGIGAVMSDSSEIIGGIIVLIGALVFYAGFLGTVYKVIADGVSIGVQDAGVGMGGGMAAQQGGQQYQGGQQGQYQGGQAQQGGDQY
jgi:hypothetical protein